MNKIKISKKTQFIFLIFGLLIATFLSFNIGFSIETDTETNSGSYVLDCLKEAQYDIDDYFNFSGPSMSLDGGWKNFRIWIDDTNPHYNWSQWVANHSWCTGSGKVNDPYLIENLYIHAGGSGGGIYIENSDKYFIIRNCWFEYGGNAEHDIGVFVDHCENGIIDNNVLINFDKGVAVIFYCYNTNVSSNIIISDGGGRAIHTQDTDDNVFYDNKILNVYSGIFFSYGDNIICDNNYLEDQIRTKFTGGVIMLRNITNSEITHNVFAGAFSYGVIRVSTIYSVDNVVRNNYISYDQGLTFNFTTIQMSTGLQTAQEDPAAIELKGSHNNYIAYNVMLREGSGGTEGIPGFNPFLILTVVCIAAVILLKRQFKH